MPKIVVYKFFTFFIVSFDTLKEPPHLHVAKEKGNRQRSAKIWLETLQIAEQGDFSDNDVKEALRVVKEHQEELLNAFADVKAGKKNFHYHISLICRTHLKPDQCV